MSKQLIDANRFDVFVIDPLTGVIEGIDCPESECLQSVELDIASNKTELLPDMIESMGRVAKLRGGIGTIQPVGAVRKPCDPSDPLAFVGKDGKRQAYRLTFNAGRRRVRSARAYNKRNGFTPEHPDYVRVSVLVEKMKGIAAIEGSAYIRLAENALRSSLNPVAEGEEINRIAYLVAKSKLAAGQEPTSAQIRAELLAYASMKQESAASIENKVALSTKLHVDLQPLIVDKKLPVSAAYLIAALPLESQLEVANSASDENGKISVAAAKEACAAFRGGSDEKPQRINRLATPKVLELANTLDAGRERADTGVQKFALEMAALALRVAAGHASIDELLSIMPAAASEETSEPTEDEPEPPAYDMPLESSTLDAGGFGSDIHG